MKSAYNQIPLHKQSRRLTQFVIGKQKYEFNRIFYGISTGPAAFSAFMSKIFRPLILNKNAITYLDDFVIGKQKYEFNRIFYGISIGPAAFSAFMSKIFRPLILNKNAITYLDDVIMQSQTKDEMFMVLEKYHQILQNEKMKAAPGKSQNFLDTL